MGYEFGGKVKSHRNCVIDFGHAGDLGNKEGWEGLSSYFVGSVSGGKND